MTSSNIKSCRYHGSARGCKKGENCEFSHDNPNSVPFCESHLRPFGCNYLANCRYRHENFDLINTMPKPKPQKKSKKVKSEKVRLENDDDKKEDPPITPPAKSNKVKIDKQTFVKTSNTKKNHYLTFPTLADYSKQSSSNNAHKVTKLTNEILSKKPSGDPKQKDTLLHILNGVAEANGKTCAFFDSSKNVKSDLAENAYLNDIDGSDKEAAKFVVTLNNLDQFVDEQKYDKADKLIELKEALTNKEDNAVINDIRNKLATAHGVSSERIVINDIYLNGVGVAYRVTDLTENEKNKIITESAAMEGKMRKLFNDYNRCAIHPALLQNSYDISMFDKLGNKTFGASGSTYKVGPPGKEKEYKQPAGWTRYGLSVLGKYGDDKWLTPFQDPGNWYRSYHGTKRESGSNIYNKGFDLAFCTAFLYGKGIYSSPNIDTAQGYSRQVTIQTKNGPKKFWYVLQVAVNPATMNNAALIPNYETSNPHYIVPTGADIRPYGILIKEV